MTESLLVDAFLDAPTKNKSDLYTESFLSTVAPEQSTGEVLLGSAYRALVLGMTDPQVDLELIPSLPARVASNAALEPAWQALLIDPGGLASPVRSGQGGRAPLRQLMPLVPRVAEHAAVLGKVRGRWVPANLLSEVLGAARGPEAATRLLGQLQQALVVNDSDDTLARVVESALREATDRPLGLPTVAIDGSQSRAYRGERATASPRTPAERFADDVTAVIALKPTLTRRQWTVFLEALLRLGLGMHVLWSCQANDAFWSLALNVAGGGAPPPSAEVDRLVWSHHAEQAPLLRVGSDSNPAIDGLIERYVFGRFGLSLLMSRLADLGHAPAEPVAFHDGTTAPEAAAAFLELVAQERDNIGRGGLGAAEWLRMEVQDLLDEPPGLGYARISSGFPKNLQEFLRYGLGSISERDGHARSYDQSYLLRSPASRRVRQDRLVQMGPAMVLLLVHACCAAYPGMPTSLEDFRTHLSEYGLYLPAGELASGRLGQDLEKLGVVVDSPDAAGGRLLVDPFPAPEAP